jgi:Na+/H+ antiporter NhaD/arsenite permease-like protein
MFWFVVFSSFLGADIAQMKSTLMLGPFGTEVQCWTTGAGLKQPPRYSLSGSMVIMRSTVAFLFGLAAGSNAGSAATLIGNPQNILIGQVGRLDFWNYSVMAIVPASIAMMIAFACIAIGWRSTAQASAIGSPTSLPMSFNRGQTGICSLALLVLLVFFTSPVPREISAILVAAFLIVSRTVPSR